jgi:hypothetical protein
VDPDIAALAGLAAAARLRVVLAVGDRRRFRARLAELSRPVDSVSAALRREMTAR